MAQKMESLGTLAIGIQGLLDKPIARKTLIFQVRTALDKGTPELLHKGFGTEQ
ncbi:hypothetical protein [Desulfopila sp. IMCC35008]|uniref:hypothetical protein n=1 Tax=Desulfopila sp. IMCC35008 TaxID=2653858 RepID=UPI0013D704DB|nr:hypothetical protein [Desulfopila sp. IMCC35008]